MIANFPACAKLAVLLLKTISQYVFWGCLSSASSFQNTNFLAKIQLLMTSHLSTTVQMKVHILPHHPVSLTLPPHSSHTVIILIDLRYPSPSLVTHAILLTGHPSPSLVTHAILLTGHPSPSLVTHPHPMNLIMSSPHNPNHLSKSSPSHTQTHLM